MKNYLVTVRAQISTEMVIPASSREEASERAKRIFECSHSPKFEMVMSEVLPSFPPFDEGGEHE